MGTKLGSRIDLVSQTREDMGAPDLETAARNVVGHEKGGGRSEPPAPPAPPYTSITHHNPHFTEVFGVSKVSRRANPSQTAAKVSQTRVPESKVQTPTSLKRSQKPGVGSRELDFSCIVG